MKLNHFWLASLLVVGFAYDKASSQDVEQSSTDNLTSVDKSEFVEPTPKERDEQNKLVQKGHDKDDVKIPLFDSVSEVRQYVVNRVREIYSTLKASNNKDNEQATRYDFKRLPKFEDSFSIGDFSKKYKVADVQFSNVTVIGMENFHSDDDVKPNTTARIVDLKMTTDNLLIVGNYNLTSTFKTASGPFIVKLLGNVTYHETIGYRSLKNEVDIANSSCGIRYGESDSDYRDLGFFTQLFRAPISCPMIDEVLQGVGKEIGHKVRPIFMSELHKTAMNMTNITELETLIRSSVFLMRNLTLKEDVSLDFNVKNAHFETNDSTNIYNGTIKLIKMSSINKFEIERLQLSIKENVIKLNATLHNTKTNGTAIVQYVEKKLVKPKKSEQPKLRKMITFNVTDLAVNITFEKGLNEDSFFISDSDWNVTAIVTIKVVTQSPPDIISDALGDFLLNHLKSVISTSFPALVKNYIQSIFNGTKYDNL